MFHNEADVSTVTNSEVTLLRKFLRGQRKSFGVGEGVELRAGLRGR